MTYSRRIRLAPIRVAHALAPAIVLLAFAVVPAFAIVHTCAPIATGVNASDKKARGAAAVGKGIDSPDGTKDGASDVHAPLPAQGTANSGSNSPGSPEGTCPT